MNKFIGCGRLTKEPDVRYNGENAVARYTLAVDGRNKDSEADFIPCVAFGKAAEFAEKYLTKGTKLIVEGHLHSGSYTNKDGNKVYTLDVVIESQEFAESKKTATDTKEKKDDETGFMNIPEGLDNELPFAPPTR